MEHMDLARVDLIVPGVIFINFILAEAHIERMYQCGFALKQGAVYQLIEGKL